MLTCAPPRIGQFMKRFNTIGILAKQDDPRVLPAVHEVSAMLLDMGCAVLVESLPGLPTLPTGVRTADADTVIDEVEMLVVVGGDGTLLRAGRRLGNRQRPILGIHHGRLGFLVDIRPEDTRCSLERVLEGEYWIEKRLTLLAEGERDDGISGPYPAINDVVIRNQSAVRMLEFEIGHGDEFISLHRADGFIVATPTGSTAYALSGGGPVLPPGVDAIALVPICPHTLSDRPLVVGADRPVRVELVGSSRDQAMMTCDGQVNHTLSPGQRLTIRRAEHSLQLIHPRSYNYFNILRNKLHWGREKPDNTA